MLENIIKPQLIHLKDKNLNNETINFLSTIGLPNDCAPFLSFLDSEEEVELMPVTDYYDFLDKTFSSLLMLGSTGDGDQIVIDTTNNCSIISLNHDDSFREKIINSDIKNLYNSLFQYNEFIEITIEKYGEDGFLDGDLPFCNT